MNSSTVLDLVWTALLFGGGVLLGLWLADNNTPKDGDSSSGQSPTEEAP